VVLCVSLFLSSNILPLWHLALGVSVFASSRPSSGILLCSGQGEKRRMKPVALDEGRWITAL
jgi:hypothetical protein